ncbi:G:T/U mismatch-specific uracil/thymine DNA-glycosylase [Georgfuchsia toluolica]|uniref:G:T/U mismatch-specific uracil/thymine DNA-glycosylase n=1 Tax=Georgfuchsia toluolica TaxID=424218 RepID=A0A916J5Q8_9PROT|nr:DNA-deoxyinosine glycosylase [Georgfuchsia toluolica]CAG4885039.1 G:T/U mismatch-specific uracil/thymine DNA-glycosylase [Georgfuchsia toluolica]
MHVYSFPPIENQKARLLILGSMPGAASLRAGQYYAHPHNAFWPIMGALVGADPALSYRARAVALKAAGIALWDVLASCEREGSLDADIHHDSVVVNDFPGFFAVHPHLTAVFFNGGMAQTCFHRHVMPLLGDMPLRFARLPSTSPANASWSRERKLEAWRKALAERGIITANRKALP